MTPAETILQNLPAVRGAFERAHNAAGAWRILLAACPALTADMTFNAFKTAAPAVLASAEPSRNDAEVPLPSSNEPPKRMAGPTE